LRFSSCGTCLDRDWNPGDPTGTGTSAFPAGSHNTELELPAALHEVKTLHGLLPICAKCKNVRNDEGYWEQIESYIGQRSGAKFTHGICPICSEELYGDAVLEVLNRPTKEDDNQG